MDFARGASKAFCRAPKSGTPLSLSTTISPSYQPSGSFMRVSSAWKGFSLAVESLPLRVKSWILPASMRASSRYPSNLISKLQSAWSPGGESTSVASCGLNVAGSEPALAFGCGAASAFALRRPARGTTGGLTIWSTASAPLGCRRLLAGGLRAAFGFGALTADLALSGSSSTTLNSVDGRVYSSLSLISSHGSCFSPRPFMRISAHLPLSLWPLSSNFKWPAFSDACASPIGCHVPSSQTMTLPGPYCPAGMVPSKLE